MKSINDGAKEEYEGNTFLFTINDIGKPILVPLTSSLYVSGKLKNAGKVLVDIGTGYYIEKVRLNTNISDMTDQQRRHQVLFEKD